MSFFDLLEFAEDEDDADFLETFFGLFLAIFLGVYFLDLEADFLAETIFFGITFY